MNGQKAVKDKTRSAELTVWSESRSVVSDPLRPHGLYSPWYSPGQNTGVGSLSLLQGIFPTQGSDLGLLHCRRILYQLSHKGSPRILEWVAFPFSRRSFQPRDRTHVSLIAGGFFTSWATREAHKGSLRQGGGTWLFYIELGLGRITVEKWYLVSTF